jgi:lipopolysaccharide/colanic/teichoic acid biosynthesis glycosyltransferase
MAKRGVDIILSLMGLILLFPLFLLIVILIRLDSRGPVLFRQVRMGRNGKPFHIFKFRTMIEAKQWAGPPVSAKNDPRVTGLGAILRRFKVNEFPQLINVLKGEMSFVGPRPEIPEFVKLYSHEQQERILSVRPGIVGPSQIHMRNEEELYAEGLDPNKYYIEHLLPKKLEIDLKYIRDRSLFKDVGYILQGIMITITGAITRRHLFENSQQISLFMIDAVLCGSSYFLAYYLRLEGEFPEIEKAILLHTMPHVILVRMFALMYFGLYGTLIRYFSSDEVIRIVKGATFSSIVIVLLAFFVGQRPHPRSVFVVDWFILVGLLTGYRASYRILTDYASQRKNVSQKTVLIYGAGNTGDLALRYLRMQGGGKVIGFIDDDSKKMRKSFQGLKVLGNRYDIKALVRLYHVDQIFIAMNDIDPEDLEHIKSLCEKAGVEHEIFALAN